MCNYKHLQLLHLHHVPMTSHASATESALRFLMTVACFGSLSISFHQAQTLFFGSVRGLAPTALCMVCMMQVNTPSGRRTEMAAIYNTSSNTFTPFHITEHPFCAGHTLLPDGRKAIIVGGKCTFKFHNQISRLLQRGGSHLSSLEQADQPPIG